MPSSAYSIIIRSYGFAYVEVLVAMMLLVIALVPAINALTDGVRGSTLEPARRHLILRNKMEEVLSKPFADLYAGTSASCSTPTTATYSDDSGNSDRRMVLRYRYSYSSNACTTSDTGVLLIKVYYEADGGVAASALQTLVSQWW